MRSWKLVPIVAVALIAAACGEGADSFGQSEDDDSFAFRGAVRDLLVVTDIDLGPQGTTPLDDPTTQPGTEDLGAQEDGSTPGTDAGSESPTDATATRIVAAVSMSVTTAEEIPDTCGITEGDEVIVLVDETTAEEAVTSLGLTDIRSATDLIGREFRVSGSVLRSDDACVFTARQIDQGDATTSPTPEVTPTDETTESPSPSPSETVSPTP